MAPGWSDDFLRRRSNEERAQDYCSIILCLWKPYSDHKTNSTAAIAEYKSHTLCLYLRVNNMCSQNAACLFFSEINKKGTKGLVIYLILSHIQPYGCCVCVCLCVYLCLFGCLVSECSLDRGSLTPIGKTVQAERSDKVTSAALSDWTHIYTFLLADSHYA